MFLLLVTTGLPDFALAQSKVTPLEATETVCAILDPGKEWVTRQGVLHIRGQVRKNRVESSEPRVDGWNTLIVNVNLDLRTMKGTLAGTFMIVPNTIDGAFEGTFQAQITDGLASGKAVAHGTGALEGQKLSGAIDDFLSNDPGPCQPRPFPDRQTRAVGIIHEPRGN